MQFFLVSAATSNDGNPVILKSALFCYTVGAYIADKKCLTKPKRPFIFSHVIVTDKINCLGYYVIIIS